MRKSTLLKIATTLTAMVLISGVFAQNTGQWATNTAVGDYVSTAGNKVTYGKQMPFWVWPSAAYNPNWDFLTVVPYATAAVITTNVTSSFAWSATGTPTITPFQTGAVDRNYATISWPIADLGTRTITVTETPASGVCAATPVTFDVTVIDVPSFTITTAATKFGLTNLIQSNCWAALNDNLSTIPFTVNTAAEEYPFAFYLDYKIYTVDGLDASGNVPVTGGDLNTGGAGVNPVAYDSRVNGVVAGVPTKTGNPISVAAGTNLIASTDFPAVTNKITVYEFDLAGYNAKVSRTSDYLVQSITTNALRDNWATYTQYGTAAKYYIVALPTPVTGPIYHIANAWGL